MKHCENCGIENEDGVLACTGCGSRLGEEVQGEAGSEVTGEEKNAPTVEPVAEKEEESASREEMIPLSEAYDREPEDSQKPKKSRRALAIAICGMLLVAAMIGLVAYSDGPSRVSLADVDQPIVYIQEEQSLKFKNSSMQSAQTITDSYYSTASFWTLSYDTHAMSMDGRYLLYLNDYRETVNAGDLYMRDLSQMTGEGKPTDRGEKIASDVTRDFFFSRDESYIFYINTKNELYAYDFQETYKLDSDVSGILDWNDGYVLYFKGNSAGSYAMRSASQDVFLAPLAPNSRDFTLKLDSDIAEIVAWNDDFSEFIYTKEEMGQDAALYEVYWKNIDADDREVLVKGVDQVIDADIATREVLYLLEKPTEFTLEDLLEDDMWQEDSAIIEPDLDDFPTLRDFVDEELGYWYTGYKDILEYFEYFEYYYYDYYMYYNEDFDEALMESLMREFSDFQELVEAYEEVAARNELRELLDESVLEFFSSSSGSTYELYRLTADGQRNRVDKGIYQRNYDLASSVYGSLEDGYAYYLKLDVADSERIKMSDIKDKLHSYSWSISSVLEDKFNGLMYFTWLDSDAVLLGGAEADGESTLAPSTYNVRLTEDLDGIYYMLSGSGASEGRLYFAPVTDGKVGSSVLVDDNIAEFFSEDLYRGQLVYAASAKASTYDLYTVNGGERERIGYDVAKNAGVSMENDGETMCFYEDYNTTTRSGDFYIYTDDKVFVADDVYDYYYRSDDLIYLMRNYRAGKGDLYAWDGENLALVDYDVTAVLDYWYWIFD